MFTGIVETLGLVKSVEEKDSNFIFTIESSISHELSIDQSVAHDGVCLTVVEINGPSHRVVAIQETLSKTSLKQWKPGKKINLERCLKADGRFDGHIVQGHVDTVARCVSIDDLKGSWRFKFQFEKHQSHMTVEKGSITINGVSLTVVDSNENDFSVHIIPYTFEHTNFSVLKVNDEVNLEFDIIGKYIAKILNKN